MDGRKLVLWVGVMASCWGCSWGETTRVSEDSGVTTQPLTSEGGGVVWGMSFVAPDTILFTLRQGKMNLLNTSTGAIRPVEGELPEVDPRGQGGLLDVQRHPSFDTNRTIYLTYSKPTERGSTTAVATAVLDNNRLSELKDIFVAEAYNTTTHHYGSRLQSDGRGHIFVTVGDRGARDLAQNLDVHNGKILRLREDGSAPEDNPFVERGGPAQFVWSYGHRNPQGLVYDKEAGELWEHEHGPRGGDEINRVQRGLNYGWPIISHGKEYRSGAQVGEGPGPKEGMEQPIKTYIPSIAPCGMLRYSGHQFPAWRGHFFSGALALQHLNRVALKGGVPVEEERLLTSLGQRIRSVIQSPDGAIIVGTDTGLIARLVPQPQASAEP